MKKYLPVFAGVSIVLLILYYTLNDLAFNNYLHDLFPLLVIFFFGQSLVIYLLLKRGSKDESKFGIYALGSIVFRLITAIFLLIVLFLLKVANPVPLAVQFMGVYLLFLAFELIMVISNLRRISG